MRTISLSILFTLPVLILQGQPNRYGLPFIHNYHYTETGGGEQNWGITRDQNGLIFVANEEKGILEFDGASWRTHPVPGDVPVRSVIAGGDGYLYAGLDGDFGRLEPDRSGSLEFRSLLDSLQREVYSEDNFWRTYYRDEKVYSCGRMGIIVYDVSNGTISFIEPPENSFLTFFIWTGICG